MTILQLHSTQEAFYISPHPPQPHEYAEKLILRPKKITFKWKINVNCTLVSYHNYGLHFTYIIRPLF